MLRTAVVSGLVSGTPLAEVVAQYLPANYAVVAEWLTQADDGNHCRHKVIIEGHDNAGWTLDDYVIPRLASGMYACTEILG